METVRAEEQFRRRGVARCESPPQLPRANVIRLLFPLGTLLVLLNAVQSRPPLGFIVELPGRFPLHPMEHRRRGMTAQCGDFRHPHARVLRQRPRKVLRRVLVDIDWAGASSLLVSEETPGIVFEIIEFLACAVVTAPLAQALGVSPMLGYIIAGVALGPQGLGLFANDEAIAQLAFIGILFLLFEAGLELSSDRLKKLTKYAFGLGTLQVVVTSALVGGALSYGGAVLLGGLAPSLKLAASVSRLYQVAVIAVSFALSAKAFVLQILRDKNIPSSKLGQAALGVLLLIEDSSGQGLDAASLASYAATAVGGLAAIGLFGGAFLQKVFDLVAGSRKREVFFGLAVLCVLGVSQVTNLLGLSPTLGALVAGVLLAESNYRTQVEADISPFKGLLVGLFFFTLGAKVDPGLLVQEWQFFLVALAGLAACKAAVISTCAMLFDLKLSQGIRLGFLLASGSGEACVIYGLADKYKVFDTLTLKVLTTIVVVSAALTPLFAELGELIATSLEGEDATPGDRTTVLDDEPGSDLMSSNIVLICGMGPLGQQVASILSNLPGMEDGLQWIGLDLDPQRVKELRDRDLPVYYGDGSRMQVLTAAGLICLPKAIVVTYATPAEVALTMERLRSSFPDVPILSHTSDAGQYARLLGIADAGNSRAACVPLVSGVTETALRLGSAAIATVTRLPENVEVELLQNVRQETERRLAERSAKDVSTEIDTFFVGSSPDLACSVWDAAELQPSTDCQITRSMGYFEAVSLLQDRVIKSSELARLASELRSAGSGGAVAGVASQLPRRSFAPGEFVCRQGEDGNEMFIVESGILAASIEEGPDTVVAEYSAGDNFGKYALILRQPRAISVAAKTHSQVVVVDQKNFWKLTQGSCYD